ncbi:MAG TPA: hypothetical protein VI488_16480 [Candidatus Angelobacter sp.]
MNAEHIITELEQQRDRITAAIEALSRSGMSGHGAGRGRRHLSAASRKKIGDAMRKTWAERKKKMKAA